MMTLSVIAARWETVERLLDEALALPAAEREAWLEALDGESALHREALRALLQTQARVETDDFLADGPRLPGGLDAPGASGEPHGGDLVGSYRLIRELGRGGMGLVWLAERADAMTARQVALKLPRIAWGDSFAERLARERDILATLEHAHIARLYDAGVDAHGRPFIAMQFVEGEPIDAYCRHHAVPVHGRIELLLQAMSAVAHAHARLVVHRDIKPGNILVSAGGQATLLDFGIAKLIEEGQPTRATALTEMSGRALTPDYASPEQIRGEPLGTASDVYSLGVVAFELLAGAKPYRLGRGTAAELEAAILDASAPLASEMATDPALRKALRGDLDAILNRALKKPVAERYPSVEAFAQDLRRHLQGEPVQARPDSARYRLGKFVGRHRLAVGMGSALALSIMAGSALSVWQAEVAREQERRATAEVRRQTEVRNLYIETMTRLSVLAAEQPGKLAQPGAVTSVLLEKLNEMAPRESGDAQARAAQLEAVMLQLNYDNRFDDSLALAQEYVALLIATKAPPIQVVTVYATMGRTLHRLRRFEESEAVRRKALAYAPEVHAADLDFLRMTVLTDLSGLLIGRGRRDEALLILNQARALAESGLAGQHVGGNVFIFQGLYHLGFDDAQALQSQRSAALEFKANGTSDPDELAFSGWHLGEALMSNGVLEEAETVLEDSLGRYRQENGRGSRNAARAFGRLASTVARRDPARAITLIEAERAALGPQATGAATLWDTVLRSSQFEAVWLAGDATAAAPLAPPELATTLAPGALRDQEDLFLYAARYLVQAGRAPLALRLVESLEARWPDARLSTLPWVRIEQTLAEVQLAAGQTAAARRTSEALATLIERAGSAHGTAFRAALSVVALAAARGGDRSAAAQALARTAAVPLPPFASAVERAECELRRAEALAALGRSDEAAAVARNVLPDLQTQSPQSPRLAQARRLSALVR